MNSLKALSMRKKAYSDLESELIDFYYHNLAGTMSDFYADDLVDALKYALQDKLNEHAQGSYEDFISTYEGIYGDLELLVPSEFIWSTDYMYFSATDVVEAVFKTMYNKVRANFAGDYDYLQEYVDRLESFDSLSTAEQVALIDSVVHAEHQTGDIFDDVDTESAKKEAEYLYNESLNS